MQIVEKDMCNLHKAIQYLLWETSPTLADLKKAGDQEAIKCVLQWLLANLKKSNKWNNTVFCSRRRTELYRYRNLNKGGKWMFINSAKELKVDRRVPYLNSQLHRSLKIDIFHDSRRGFEKNLGHLAQHTKH